MVQTQTVAIVCKFCGSKDVVKYGVRGGIQYYWCKACDRKFSGNFALPWMHVPPERIATAVNLFYEGLSLAEIQRSLGTIYNETPSDSTVYEWVVRFTKEAIDKARGYKAHTGKLWAADETVLGVRGSNIKEGSANTLWFWDVIDEATRFLLASHLSPTRTTRDAETLFNQARERSITGPRLIVTDKLAAYLDGIERVFGGDVKHIQSQGMRTASHNNIIERFHGTIKQRTKVMRHLKSRESAKLIMGGWLIHYNFFRPHESLSGETPGEVAQVGFPYKSWKELVTDGYHGPS